MIWKSLLSLLSSLAGWLQERQLIKAGETKQRAKDLEKSAEISRNQDRAAADAADSPSELADRLRDPDRRN